MYSTELQIRDFLLHKGVLPFWIDSAVGYIKQGLAGNNYLATHVLTQSVTIKNGHVSTYKATITVTYPDTQRKEVVTLRYTFRPTAHKAHKLWLEPVVPQA